MTKDVEELFESLKGLFNPESEGWELLEKLKGKVEDLTGYVEDFLEDTGDQYGSKKLKEDPILEHVRYSLPRFQEQVLDELDLPLIRLPHSLDSYVGVLIPKLEEYINQHGVESTLKKLTQDHSQEVEDLQNQAKFWETTYERVAQERDQLQEELMEVKSELDMTIQEAGERE